MAEKTQQRRSIRNVTMTKKYHLSYMGPQVFLTLAILATIYGLIMYRLFSLAEMGRVLPYSQIAVFATLAITLTALMAGGTAVLTAHRVAGVHIKLLNVINQVADGNFDARLKFRSTDKLEEVEDSFNRMMTTLQQRVATVPENGSAS